MIPLTLKCLCEETMKAQPENRGLSTTFLRKAGPINELDSLGRSVGLHDLHLRELYDEFGDHLVAIGHWEYFGWFHSF
jgi:hypothetical protein